MDLPFVHIDSDSSFTQQHSQQQQQQQQPSHNFRLDQRIAVNSEIIQSKISQADVILFSGCMDNQITVDVSAPQYDPYYTH
jgi:hypothetical protein